MQHSTLQHQQDMQRLQAEAMMPAPQAQGPIQ